MFGGRRESSARALVSPKSTGKAASVTPATRRAWVENIRPSRSIGWLESNGPDHVVAQLRNHDESHPRQHLTGQAREEKRDLAERACRPFRVDNHERLR